VWEPLADAPFGLLDRAPHPSVGGSSTRPAEHGAA
jgi:hypothetical protein